MSAKHSPIAIIAILALAAFSLAGCSTAGGNMDSSMSLMDRFLTGQSLTGPDEDETGLTAAAHISRGDAFLTQGRSELAFDQYAKAQAKDPEQVEARYKKGDILLGNGLYNQAIVEFTAVLEKDPDHAGAHEAMGLIYFSNGLYPEARTHLERAAALDNGLIKAHVLLGATLNFMNDFEGAAEQFESAAELSPSSGYIYNNLGLSQVRLGEHEQALVSFRRALMLGAPVDRTCNNLGMTLFKLGRPNEALEAFKCAGDEASAYNNLGYAHFLAGQYEQAMLCFEKAIELRPAFYVRADENLKRARLAAEFEKSAPRIEEPEDKPAGKALPMAFKAAGAPKATAAVAREDKAVKPEITKVMKIYSDSPARLKIQKPGSPIFSVHVSSFRTGEKAAAHVAILAKKGLDARMVETEIKGKGHWFRVLVGAYDQYDKAMEAMKTAAEKIGRDGKDLRVIRCADTTLVAGAEL